MIYIQPYRVEGEKGIKSMEWGNNRNYMNNPCRDCQKPRLWKDDNGKYIRCDSNCPVRDVWRAEQEQKKQAKMERIHNADTIRQLEHHRCTTKRRKKVV